jgi:hypothetical protein
MTLNKSLTAVCLGSTGRCTLTTCNIHQPLWLVSVYGSSSDWTEELCFRPAFCPGLQLVIVVWKISSFRNCLWTAPFTERRGILSFFLELYEKKKI